MDKISSLLVFTVLSASIGVCECDNRFLNKDLFSTRTPYFWSRDADENIDTDSAMFTAQGTCKAVYVDGVVRHGSRYPEPFWVNKMDKLKAKFKGRGTSFIDNWENIFRASQQGDICDLGRWEMFYLGKRFGARFYSLLHLPRDNIRYFSSSKPRCQDSGDEFFSGLKTVNATSSPTMTYSINDTMLRFYRLSEKYNTRVKLNKTAMAEYHEFQSTPEVTQVVKSVRDRLNLVPKTRVNLGDVIVMLKMCSFELTFKNNSDWCQYFTLQDLEVLDYLFDLDQYWRISYGYDIIAEMTCPLVSSVFRKMDEAIAKIANNERYTTASFRFTHANVILPLFSALGLFKQEPILASTYVKYQHRIFRTSHISPMSASVFFVLYSCNNNYKIKILVNEEEVTIPACGSAICSYDIVREKLSRFVDKCDFASTCGLPGDVGTASYLQYSLILVVTCVLATLS